MTTALQKPILGNQLSDLVKQPKYADRFKEVLREKTAQFVSSLLQVGASLGKDCDPQSIISGAMIAAAVDLPIDKNLGFCWLVPYKKDGVKYAQFQMGYKGYVQLALRTGQYSRLNVCEIYEGELENYNRLTGDLAFKPEAKSSDKIIGYASYLRLVSGFEHAEFWAVKDVEDHAKRYSQAYKSAYDTPWKSHFDEMAMKTVLSAHIRRWGPMSIQVAKAHGADNAVMRDIDGDPEFFDNPKEVTEPAKKPALPPAKKKDEPKAEPDDLPVESTPVNEAATDDTPTVVEVVKSKPAKEPPKERPPQDELAEILKAVPFATFAAWALKRVGHAPASLSEGEAQDATDYCDLSAEVAARILTDSKGLRNVVTIYGAKPV